MCEGSGMMERTEGECLAERHEENKGEGPYVLH